jgi:hypothetical protein
MQFSSLLANVPCTLPPQSVPAIAQHARPPLLPWLIPLASLSVAATQTPSSPSRAPPGSRPQRLYSQQFSLFIEPPSLSEASADCVCFLPAFHPTPTHRDTTRLVACTNWTESATAGGDRRLDRHPKTRGGEGSGWVKRLCFTSPSHLNHPPRFLGPHCVRPRDDTVCLAPSIRSISPIRATRRRPPTHSSRP